MWLALVSVWLGMECRDRRLALVGDWLGMDCRYVWLALLSV